MSIQRSRNGSVRARREHQKAIDWVSRRLCPTPHSRKLYGEKKKRKKENAKALFDDDPPCRSTRAPERLRSRRACFLETWMRRTFLSRESRVLVFSQIRREKREKQKSPRTILGEKEPKKKDKKGKAQATHPPLF